MTVAAAPVRVERLDGGSLLRATLCAGKGNVIDRAVVEALAAVAATARETPEAKAVLLDADGPHFSFGASVAEHLPDEAAGMLARFHALFRAMLDAPVLWIAAVRGRCLGGGLELASFCQRVVAAPDAVLGQPEIVLGVFAPVASVVLPDRVGRPAAEDLLLTGRTVGAGEARAMRLVDDVADDPTAAALAWARAQLGPKSASSLRFAVRAARAAYARRLADEVERLERLYLDGLMRTEDAVEGLRAFVEKRAPAWRHR